MTEQIRKQYIKTHDAVSSIAYWHSKNKIVGKAEAHKELRKLLKLLKINEESLVSECLINSP